MSQHPLAPAALQALVAAQRQRIYGSNPYAAAMARITAAQQSYVQQQLPQSSLPQTGPSAPYRGEIPAVFNPLIVNAFKRYWTEGTYSDLALDSGTRTFFVHRTILALHSKYFRTLLDGPFKESGKKSIELVDDHPVVLKWFLYSLYNFRTPDAATADMPERYMLSLMVSIYLMADKYGCEGLMKWIAQNFYTHWTKRRDTKEVLEALSVVFTASSPRVRQELFKGFDPIVRADLAGFFRHADTTKTLISAPDWLMRQTAMLAYELHGGWN